MVFIEDPAMVVAGVTTGEMKRVCPHGFSPNDTCQCYLHPEADPGVDGCHGRDFSENPVEKVVTSGSC